MKLSMRKYIEFKLQTYEYISDLLIYLIINWVQRFVIMRFEFFETHHYTFTYRYYNLYK